MQPKLQLLAGAFLSLILSTTAQDTDTDTDAPLVTDNQPLSFHHATLLRKDETSVYGGISITSRASTSALQVEIFLGGIPEGEYLTYYIHEYPVPEDGDCYATGAHLDPYDRGDDPPCDIKAPQTCQVGDLSGKHGPAYAPPGGVFNASFPEFFLSNNPGDSAYFGDLSFVVHGPDGTRLTCGNFEQLGMS